MTVHQKMLYLFEGLGGVLAVAWLIGWWLERKFAAAGPNAVVENLNARVRTWCVMILLIGAAFLGGEIGVILLFAFCSFNALREFLTLIQTRRGDHWALLVGFFLVLPLQYYLIWIEWYGLYSVFIPVYAFLFLPIISAVRGETQHYMERIAETQWGLMIAVFCLSHVPALLTLEIPGFDGGNLLLIAFLILVVQASDVLQYVWGKLLGRHKVAPNLSPSKTWEGLIGGVASATALGAAMWWITPFTPLQAAAIAFIINLMGFFGGLVMSAIKRDRGVKDWGHMIAGHGGMLDRLDSVIFAAPVFFHVTRYWWTP